VISIPLRALSEFEEEVAVEDTVYRFAFKWNSRGEFYSLDLKDSAGVVLIAGLKMALNASLLRSHNAADLPTGEFLVLDSGGSNDPIAFEDFDARISLVYLTRDEYAAI
jgi:hypothetical protein